MRPARFRRGFTLIEVLVALVILSVMAATAFKGMDSISRAREVAEGKLKRTLRLQSVMTQWDADMTAAIDIPTINPSSAQGQRAFVFNGSRLRMVREAPGGGVQVIAWSLRDGRWERWAGRGVRLVGDLEDQWKQADQLKGDEAGTLTMLKGVEQWQLYTCTALQGGQCLFANAQSTQQTGPNAILPTGVRSMLTVGPRSGFEGVATRDTFLGAH
ncbi:MAG: prepilin-type N-terminal cleavage/methylation domain-containing protein [Rubrivivax sp.]|nr:MAG: prepilin-type N-terminal cleavage/methylation domain-containing protein [Rubrivivax sp.]